MSKVDNLENAMSEVLEADVQPTPEEEVTTPAEPQDDPAPAPEKPETPEEPVLGETYNGVAVPEKFIGKPVSELVKSYMGLETKLGDPARSNNARQQLKDAGLSEKALDKLGNLDEETLKKIEGMDFTEMGPAEFAQVIIGITQAHSQNQIQQLVEQQQRTQNMVRNEVAEAKEEYPLLASSPEYRQAVLNVVTVAEQQGQEITLKDACAQVQTQLEAINTTLGYAKPEVQQKKDKGSKAQVETETPTPAVPGDDEATSVKNAILNAGSGMSPIGGL